MAPDTNSADRVRSALSAFRGTFLVIGLVSGVVNILALTGSFYMLQVYDRVLTSHSVPTLVAFSVLAGGLYVFQGALDVLRGQIMVRVSAKLDRSISPIAHGSLLHLPLLGIPSSDAQRPIRDVEAIRTFLGSQGPIAFFDLPWMPLYLAFVFFLHFWLGILASIGLLVLVSLTLLTEWLSSDLSTQASQAATERYAAAESNARNAEVLRAMGFGQRAALRFHEINERHLWLQSRSSDIVGGISGVSRVFRMLLQSAVLGLGAYLTLKGEVTAGAIIAASIATSRALAPIELAIGHWKAFVGARQARSRLLKTLTALPDISQPIDLPVPHRSLSLEGVSVAIAGTQRVVVNNVTFSLEAGQAVGVIGPSGSGKSTLARAIVGVWPVVRGAVRLDAAAVEHWPEAYFSKHIGYVAQDVSLMDGPIAANIARFDPDADSLEIIRAAQAADIHEMILRLPDGYETQLGHAGTGLSAGQRQRLALARALYGDPFLVVLDEPNSNLDNAGETALTRAIQGVRDRGGIVVVIAHRPSALQAVDHVAVVKDGQLSAFGPKNEVLQQVLETRPAKRG